MSPESPAPTDIILIRHGVPDAVAVFDPPLGVVGRAQAAALNGWLLAGPEADHIVAVYSSPLVRARQTVEPLAAALGLEIGEHHDLREWEDPSQPVYRLPESLAATPRGVAFIEGRFEEFAPPHDAPALRARMLAAVREIAAPHPGGTIAVASHGGALNALLAAVVETERTFLFNPGYTSVSRIQYWPDGRLVLVSVNETAHLDELRLAALAQGTDEPREDVA